MRVLLDENIPVGLTEHLGPHQVETVSGRGWSGVKNGELLRRATGNFDVLVTMDRNLRHQQPLANQPFAVVLLNSDPHSDHAGGLAALKEASGAELWASESSAYSLASGGDDPDILLPIRLLLRARIIGYPRVAVDRRFSDRDTIVAGPLAVTAHVTGGHTRGCTSYSFQVHEGDDALTVESACSLGILGVSKYPEQHADLERSLQVLRSLPADIWVTSHNRLWGRYRKFAARDTAESPSAPFVDPDGYRTYLDSAEARFKRGAEQ